MSSRLPIYIVCSGGGVDQAFANLQDAAAFASERPGACISSTYVRQSMDEAVVVFDRRVRVAQGVKVFDRTILVHQFIDDPLHSAHPADVECFQDSTDAGWHIAGFGSDKAALDAQVQRAIDHICGLSRGVMADAASRAWSS